MNISTLAIVLHRTRINDNTAILHLYTREAGRIPYYLYGTKSKAGKHAILHPLALLQIEAIHQEYKEIQQLKEWQLAYVDTHTTADIYRQTEAIFIAEILFRTLTHPMPDPLLFDMLKDVIIQLDTRPDPENVHLEFLIAFIEKLGFGIDYDLPSAKNLLPLLKQMPITNSQRQIILADLMQYYKMHLPDFQNPKSLDVMMQVFHN